MDAGSRELERLKELQREGRRLIDQGRLEQASRNLDEALALEERNARTIELMALLAEKQGDAAKAERLQAQAQQYRKEARQREIEAEIRGHHELWGEPGRHERG